MNWSAISSGFALAVAKKSCQLEPGKNGWRGGSQGEGVCRNNGSRTTFR